MWVDRQRSVEISNQLSISGRLGGECLIWDMDMNWQVISVGGFFGKVYAWKKRQGVAFCWVDRFTGKQLNRWSFFRQDFLVAWSDRRVSAYRKPIKRVEGCILDWGKGKFLSIYLKADFPDSVAFQCDQETDSRWICVNEETELSSVVLTIIA